MAYRYRAITELIYAGGTVLAREFSKMVSARLQEKDSSRIVENEFAYCKELVTESVKVDGLMDIVIHPSIDILWNEKH